MRIKIFICFVLLNFLGSLSFAEIDEWSIRIGVKTDRYEDIYNFIGVEKVASLYYDAKDLPEPPLSPSGLSLYFPHDDWPFNPGKYATDFRPPIISNESYEFVVEARKDTKLTLFWSNIENVPKIYRLTLIDRERGISVDMRERTEYAFDCSPECKNVFRIVVERKQRKENLEVRNWEGE